MRAIDYQSAIRRNFGTHTHNA